jgi:cyclase
MLKKRIIPCLDIKDGRTVKGINFVGLKDAGDPIALAKQYVLEGADELVFLDITASIEKRKTLRELVTEIAAEINIPFTVGGGISTMEDVSVLIKAGADKVSVNSAAVYRPELIAEIAREFGSQCLVLAIDSKWNGELWEVFTQGGRKKTGINTLDWALKAEALGAGEILLTSMNQDGTKTGFALDLYQTMSEALNIPIIASGGAGSMEHFAELFSQTKVTAGLAASIFHYGEIPIPELKTYLKTQKLAIR